MIGAKTIVIGAVAAGLVATGGPASALVASPGTAPASVLTAFSVPLDNDHNGDRDGRRDHDGGWAGHPWGISVDTCTHGGGHVVWARHRCEGGKYDGFHLH